MPRFNGGIGRTGKKHKKVPKFDVHRQEKGDCGPKTLDAPATADPPVQSAVEVDSEAKGVPLRSRDTPARSSYCVRGSCARLTIFAPQSLLRRR